MSMEQPIIETRSLNLFYGSFQALINVDLQIQDRQITALIGPSGCGKSTLVRVFNRMNDLIDGVRVTGRVLVQAENIYAPSIDMIALRRKVGMVFQRPNPFPLTVAENITFGLEVHRSLPRSEFRRMIEESLKGVLLWEDLKDRLDAPALGLSLEQQQRLCIARVLAMKPKIILMDEPCSALDPIATMKIEDLMRELKRDYTIVIVTHNMQQAARASDFTAFMYLGELIEFGETKSLFRTPRVKRTEDYITGRFG
ncbi:MAG: phosphate ABC transporter ATP-binding protein PstB [Bacteroidetes bacterium]|jgi:phosphate transport system ATP-binding protein|nr:phosphate ABC transporter ATP-binding protein PstB [Bacteroidota bacterium]